MGLLVDIGGAAGATFVGVGEEKQPLGTIASTRKRVGRDSNPLPPGSRPGASATSASYAAGAEGFEPSRARFGVSPTQPTLAPSV